MKIAFRLLTVCTVAAVAGSAADNITFQWPDSSKYWRVLVNVNDYVESYLKKHPDYFVHDTLVTDFQVLNVQHGDEDRAKERYEHIRKMLMARGMTVGTYISGRTVLPDAMRDRFPPVLIAIEQMPPDARYLGSWPGIPLRRIINVADANTRHALQARIKEEWEEVPAPIRYVDNIPPHPKMLREVPWSAACAHMHELSQIAESMGSRVVFNIPMQVGDMSDHETQELIDAVGENGLSLEMPWSIKIRQSKEATERARRRYRQLLDSGMAIIFIPNLHQPENQGLDLMLAEWVRTWRKPTDRLYLSVPFFKRPDPDVVMLQ